MVVHILCSNLEILDIMLPPENPQNILKCLNEPDFLKGDKKLLPVVKRLSISIGVRYGDGTGEETYTNFHHLDYYYASICFRFRSTLTRLDLNSINTKFQELERFGGFYHYLSQFPNLQELNWRQETTLDVLFRMNPTLVTNIDIPLLVESNKNLNDTFFDGACRFVTTTNEIISVDSTDGDNIRRIMDHIGVMNLKSIDTGNMVYIAEKLII